MSTWKTVKFDYIKTFTIKLKKTRAIDYNMYYYYSTYNIKLTLYIFLAADSQSTLG